MTSETVRQWEGVRRGFRDEIRRRAPGLTVMSLFAAERLCFGADPVLTDQPTFPQTMLASRSTGRLGEERG